MNQTSVLQDDERQVKTMAMTAEIRADNKLVVTIDLQKPAPSGSGKTMVVASSHGNQATTAQMQGKPVIVGLNAYIKR